MTPQEKAEELFIKMQLDWGCNSCDNVWAKECALIAVDEILNSFGNLCMGKMFYADIDTRRYWQEVKKEIEKL